MLTDAGQVRLLGNLPADTNAEFIETFAAEAERELKGYIGSAVYDAAADAAATDDPQADKNKLRRAEAFLTLERLLPVMNIRANPDSGGLVSSVGFGESRTNLLNRSEVMNLASMYNDWAMEIIAEYTSVAEDDTTVGDGISILAP